MYIIKIILVILASFMGLFFLLSLIGLLWVPTYKEIISNLDWFSIYSLLIGWWISPLIADEFLDFL
jgi:hypothetical protein